MAAHTFFTEEEKKRIVEAIARAEKDTSGEIRLHIETKCRENVLDRASYIFGNLEMHQTAERNGVLFYLATDSHKYAILGDVGINTKVGNDFWDEVRQLMAKHFQQRNFCEGLIEGILLSGQKLKEHFPYRSDDVNELSDEISFGS